MSKVLISIKPEYIAKIFSGEKKYEYRKTKPKNLPTKFIIYCTAPISAIVGEAKVVEIIEDTPNNIWNITKKESGSDERSFLNYFKNKDIAVAFKLTEVKRYPENISLCTYGIKHPPQSFIYLKETTQ